MSDSAMAGILLILCIFVFFQVLGDITLIRKKRNFIKYIKEQFAATLAEKEPLLMGKEPDFACIVKSNFMEEKRSAKYVAAYYPKDDSYCMLAEFFYDEKEQIISERLEITKFTKESWNDIISKYKTSFLTGIKMMVKKLKGK